MKTIATDLNHPLPGTRIPLEEAEVEGSTTRALLGEVREYVRFSAQQHLQQHKCMSEMSQVRQI